MTKSKTTKKALFASALSLILCFAMLLGTTYAWFTDSVTSANNIIKSGTLDIALEYQSLDNGTWGTKTEITNEAQSTAIFNYDKWEPGYSEVKLVTISNKGTLALKYKLNVVAHLKDGETAVSKLADVIDVYYLELPAGTTSVTAPTSFADAKAAGLVKVGTLADVINNNITTANGALLPAGSTATPTEKEAVGSVSFVMMLHMQEEAGNEYQDLSIGNGFDLQLLATQYTEETDSFDDQYDKDAEYLVPVRSAKELTNALADGKNVELTENIDLSGTGSAYTNDTKIDLAGNELTFSGGTQDAPAGFAANEGATINIINTSAQRATITLGANEVLQAGIDSVLNLENVDLTIEAGGVLLAGHGTINLKNCNVTVKEGAIFQVMFASTYYTGISAGLNIENSTITVENANGIVCHGGYLADTDETIVNFVSGTMNVAAGCTGFTLGADTTLNIGEAVTISCANNATEYTIPGNKVTVNDNR